MKFAAIINTASGSVPNSAAADVQDILESEKFKEFVEQQYKIGGNSNVEVISPDELD